MIGKCLGKPLASILGHLRAVFPPAAACLAAQGSSSSPADPLNQTGPAMAGNLMLDDYAEEEEGLLCAIFECLTVCMTRSYREEYVQAHSRGAR